MKGILDIDAIKEALLDDIDVSEWNLIHSRWAISESYDHLRVLQTRVKFEFLIRSDRDPDFIGVKLGERTCGLSIISAKTALIQGVTDALKLEIEVVVKNSL